MTNQRPAKSLYTVVLLAYPRDFRVRFGTEMTFTFSEVVRQQRERNGIRGVLFAWCSALWEVPKVACPLRLQNSMATAFLLSLLVSSALTLSFFAAVSPHCRR